jgi:hypothetical protein
LQLEDSYLIDSVHGVSGLKDYNFSITRLTNTSFESIPSQLLSSCVYSDSITLEYNPSGNIESSDLQNTSFNCEELKTA